MPLFSVYITNIERYIHTNPNFDTIKACETKNYQQVRLSINICFLTFFLTLLNNFANNPYLVY